MSNRIINWFKFASPQSFYPLAGKMIPWFWALAVAFGIAGLSPDGFFGLTGWSRLGRAVGVSLFLGTAVTLLVMGWRGTAPRRLDSRGFDAKTQRGAGRKARDPDCDGTAPLGLVVEHVADQRERRGCERGAREPEDRPRHDELRGTGRESRQQRGCAEGRRARHQQAAPADAVAQRAHGHQRAGDQEAVDVEHPQQLGRAGLELLRELRHREVQHRQVHGVDQAGQRQHGEADPFPGAGPGGRGGGRHAAIVRDPRASQVP